jgi:hypothetical protein
MSIDDTKSLEKKVDLLIEESQKANLERKREKILSKVDGLYNVLITFSAFIAGILVSQRGFVIANPLLLLSLIGVLFSAVASFTYGIKGMINDSIENRVLAWCLLFTSLTYYLINAFVTLNVSISVQGLFWLFVSASIISFVLGIIQGLLNWIFVSWIEKKLSSLLGEKIDVYSKIERKIRLRLWIIIGLTIVSFIIIGLLISVS